MFELLANRRRRYLVYYLSEAESEEKEVFGIDDVATRIEEWEREWDDAESPEAADRREAIRIGLHHNHLPRLSDAGLIDYDARTKTVRNWNTSSIERWVRDKSNELPHLRNLFDAGDSAGENPR